MTLLSKQLYFSKIYKQSQLAYYAADDALACALEIDDTYQGADGLGIFPSSTSTTVNDYMESVVLYVNSKRALADPLLTDFVTLRGPSNPITCANSVIFEEGSASVSQFATGTEDYAYHYTDTSNNPAIEYGLTSTYKMKMDLGLDPLDITNTRHLYRCAKVTVNKTQSWRQIISQGYAECDKPNGTVERAVVNTTTTN